MRVKLTLLGLKKATLLPLNYNYAVASLVYLILDKASAEFAARLHDEGYESQAGRRFKLFTFSRLTTGRRRVAGDKLILESGEVSLQISSPVSDFIEHLVAGLFQIEVFNIAGAEFRLLQAETIAPPVFGEQMSFRALSPITEAVRDEQNRTRYLSIADDWSEIIGRNLARKYQALYGRAPEDARVCWNWDEAYLGELAKRNRRASVLIEIGNRSKVRGWLAPFTIAGSKELIELGYEAGFGNSNAMGFGMAEAV
jgi:CRISPR-associated endoribonuclease Cas6